MFGLFKRKSKLPSKITYDEAKQLARNKDHTIRSELASRDDVQPEILYFLAEDKVPEVRRSIAANAAAPRHADLVLARDHDDDVRADLALKIGRLIPGITGGQSERLQEITFEILAILAQDQLPRVRRIIAEEIKHATHAPKPLVAKLAQDVELIVAAPILEFSPLLNDSDLLEIIHAGVADGGLSAISRRSAVSDKVARAIVAANDIPAVATLLANPSAQIREDTLDQIIERAEKAEPLHEPLARRPELSLGAIRRIAGFVSAAILEVMRTEHKLDDDTAKEVSEAVKRRIQKESTEQIESVADKVAKLQALGRLTEDAVTQAAELGQRGFLAEALALKAGVSAAVVNKMMDSRSGKAVTAISWKAGLTARGSMKLQRHGARIAANAMIHARDGVNYALSDTEMNWFLTYFREQAEGTAPAA